MGSEEFLVPKEQLFQNFNETHFLLTPSINKVKNGNQKLSYDEDTKKYIEVRFAQRITDYEK